MKFDELIEFAITAGKLKKLRRTGWVRHKIEKPESVADHSFRTALLAFVLPHDFPVNREKVMAMALIHDLAESLIGDITPNDSISTEDKHEMEMKAMRKICKPLQNGQELISLFEEFENNKSPEAKFVRSIDKFEMMIQAYEYETANPISDLKEFWDFGDNLDFGNLQDAYNSLTKLRVKK